MSKTPELDVVGVIAAEYEAKGYTVLHQPEPSALPSFLRDWRPDLVAVSQDESVVIEVKNRTDLRDPGTAALAEALAAHPRWRLELIVSNPPSASEIPSDQALADDALISKRLDEAESLLASSHLEAALLLAWSAAESVLRGLTKTHDPEAERRGSSYLIKRLYSIGALEGDRLDEFLNILDYRNALSHGFSRSPITTGLVKRLIASVREIHQSLRAEG